MSKKQQNRLKKISQLLARHRNVQVDELSRLFGVSENTVRRDLAHLEHEHDDIVRFRGGALKRDIPAPHLFNYNKRATLNLNEKKRLAEYALTVARNHSGLILDSGTTCAILADKILKEEGLGSWKPTILTPSSVIFDLLKGCDRAGVVLSGGFWDIETQGFYGLPAERFFADTHVAVAFLAVMGISAKGISINSFQEVPLKQSILKASDQKIVLADSSKISVSTMGSIALLQDIDLLVTGKEAQGHPDMETISSQVETVFV